MKRAPRLWGRGKGVLELQITANTQELGVDGMKLFDLWDSDNKENHVVHGPILKL